MSRVRRFRFTVLAGRLACLSACLFACAALADSGRFVVEPSEVETSAGRAEARELEETEALESLADTLNELLVLPRAIGLAYLECDDANAYYDSDAHDIRICVELLQGMAETIDGQYEDDDSAAEALAGAFVAVLLHEAGHALVDVLELPVTGREEDAVDQLSAWMLIEADDVASVLGAAASYYTEFDPADEDFSGEHSLDRQRYFNLLCWAYGSDPDAHEDLIDTWDLPESRADQCEAEYAQLDRSWSRLLREHLRAQDTSGPVRTPVAQTVTRPAESPRGSTAPYTAPAPPAGTTQPFRARAFEKHTTEPPTRTDGRNRATPRPADG